MITRRTIAAGLLAAPALSLPKLAGAQTFPSKPCRFVIPYPGGGIVDIAGRSIAEAMAADLGQPVIVDPRPGGNSIIGTEIVAKSPPDGHTWVLATLSHAVVGHLQPLPYDPLADFQGVAMIGVANAVALVPASLPVASLKELVAYAKGNPGKVNYLNPGNGSSIHLSGELLKVTAGIDMVGVPYRGLPPGIPDLLDGRLQFAMLSVPLCIAHVRSGKLKALAYYGEQRHADLPEVPTMAEAGFADAEVKSWYTLAVPAKTRPSIVERIHVAATKALADPEARKRLAAASISVGKAMSPAEVQSMYRSESERYGKLVKAAGIKGD